MGMRQLPDCVQPKVSFLRAYVHLPLPHVPHFPCIQGKALHKCLLSSSIPFTLSLMYRIIHSYTDKVHVARPTGSTGHRDELDKWGDVQGHKA